MNKKMLSMITALTVAAGALGTAAARTQTASLGTYNSPANDDNFSYSTLNGEVQATGVVGAPVPWQLGLAIDTFGMKTAFVRARATAAGAALRLRCATPTGGIFSTSPFVNIPVSGGYGGGTTLLTPSAVAPVNGTCFIDARMNSGARILNVRYDA